MSEINLDSKVTLKEAYLSMFEFLDRWWNEHGKPDDVGDILSELQLWQETSGKRRPFPEYIFPEWIDCVTKVMNDEKTPSGYINANVKLNK